MPQKGLSGSTLKLIAIITMLIDHIGAAVIARLLIAGQGSEMLYKIYYAMRAVGRVAFPIFCFLLVEGFFTRAAGKNMHFGCLDLPSCRRYRSIWHFPGKYWNSAIRMYFSRC